MIARPCTRLPARPRARSFIRLLAVAAFATAAWLPVATTVSAQSPESRVVIQVSDADPGKWNLALNNAKNLQTDLGPKNVDVEIVAYGPGIGMLKSDSVVGSRIQEALDAGVRIVACENTMRGQKLTKPDMLDKIGYVPAGVVEIMRRQQEHWSYLRP